MRQQCILGFHECAGYFTVTVDQLELLLIIKSNTINNNQTNEEKIANNHQSIFCKQQ